MTKKQDQIEEYPQHCRMERNTGSLLQLRREKRGKHSRVAWQSQEMGRASHWIWSRAATQTALWKFCRGKWCHRKSKRSHVSGTGEIRTHKSPSEKLSWCWVRNPSGEEPYKLRYFQESCLIFPKATPPILSPQKSPPQGSLP